MSKTKKISIIVGCLLCICVIVCAISVSLLIKKSYGVKINSPSQIIIYYDKSTNVVFENGDREYDKIYSLIKDSQKQSLLKAFFCGELKNSARVIHHENQTVDLKSITIAFRYNSPQVVRLKKSIYSNDNITYWYQSLIFEISPSNNFAYNKVAIVAPDGASNYIDNLTYSLHYEIYSNYSKLYKYVNSL